MKFQSSTLVKFASNNFEFLPLLKVKKSPTIYTRLFLSLRGNCFPPFSGHRTASINKETKLVTCLSSSYEGSPKNYLVLFLPTFSSLAFRLASKERSLGSKQEPSHPFPSSHFWFSFEVKLQCLLSYHCMLGRFWQMAFDPVCLVYLSGF